MSAVWKYPLYLADGPIYRVNMPPAARILHVREQDGAPTLWALVDPLRDSSTEERVFRILGTGHGEVRPGDAYVGTAHISGFVWHVFEAAGDV